MVISRREILIFSTCSQFDTSFIQGWWGMFSSLYLSKSYQRLILLIYIELNKNAHYCVPVLTQLYELGTSKWVAHQFVEICTQSSEDHWKCSTNRSPLSGGYDPLVWKYNGKIYIIQYWLEWWHNACSDWWKNWLYCDFICISTTSKFEIVLPFKQVRMIVFFVEMQWY